MNRLGSSLARSSIRPKRFRSSTICSMRLRRRLTRANSAATKNAFRKTSIPTAAKRIATSAMLVAPSARPRRPHRVGAIRVDPRSLDKQVEYHSWRPAPRKSAAITRISCWARSSLKLGAILPTRLIGGCRMADDPSLFDQFEQWYANSRDTEALDPKTKALIGLAVVLTGNCQP